MKRPIDNPAATTTTNTARKNNEPLMKKKNIILAGALTLACFLIYTSYSQLETLTSSKKFDRFFCFLFCFLSFPCLCV